MRQVPTLAALLFVLLTVSGSSAQTDAKKSFEITKDPQAMMIAQSAVTAMGGAEAILRYQDSLATGRLTIHEGNTPVSFPITLRSKGTHQTRVEVQMASGTNIRIMNQGRAALQKPDHTAQALGLNNTVRERVDHIPLLSMLAEYQSPNISVASEGTAEVKGRSTSVIALSFVPHGDLMQGPFFAAVTRTLFYVDQVTGMVDKVQYSNYEEGHSQQSHRTLEEYLSQYETVDGIAVPFHQTTYANGKLQADLVLKSVTFNVGLSDSEFTLPQRGQQ